jgi:HSP20 family protein
MVEAVRVEAGLEFTPMAGWRPYDPWPSPVREALEQLMNEPRQRAGGPVPMPMNVYEDGDALVVEASLPGVAPEDVELSSQDGVLTIRARSKVTRREYLHQEIHDVEYLRRISLPADCRFEQAEANVEHGLVTIRVPKVRPKPPEKIRIQITRKQPS